MIDVAAKAAVPGTDAVTCLAGEPQPKVLPIPGDNNDQIYENPSEQYVPHITGHVTQGWDNGVAKITYVTDAGYEFANGSTTKVVTVNEIRRNIHWVVPFSGDPNPATCTAAGSFDVNADGVASQWRDDTFYFDGGKVTLLVDRTVPGVVNLYVFSTDGDTLLDGLDPAKWNDQRGRPLGHPHDHARPAARGVVRRPDRHRPRCERGRRLRCLDLRHLEGRLQDHPDLGRVSSRPTAARPPRVR